MLKIFFFSKNHSQDPPPKAFIQHLCELLTHRTQSSQHFLPDLHGKGDCTATNEWELGLRTGGHTILGPRKESHPTLLLYFYLTLAIPLTRGKVGIRLKAQSPWARMCLLKSVLRLNQVILDPCMSGLLAPAI